MRTSPFVAACALALLAVSSAAEPELVLRVPDSAATVPDAVARIDIDLAAAAAAAGWTGPVRSDRLAVFALDARGACVREAVSQFDPAGAPPADGSAAKGTLLWRLGDAPPGGGERRFALSFDRGAPAPVAVSGLKVIESAEGIAVETDRYRVFHPRTRGGGLPSEIVFRRTGLRDGSLAFNDRMHDGAARRGYWLRNDAHPEVRVAGRGPLRVSISVCARYLDAGGSAPASAPVATYMFHYRDGSPTVEIEIGVRQLRAVRWSELHVLELHHKTAFYPRWALGPDARSGTFSPPQTKGTGPGGKSIRGQGWGAFLGNAPGETLALAGSGSVIVHDGAGHYGTYIHGPWVTAWDRSEWRGRMALGIAPEGNAPESVAGWAAGLGSEPRVALEFRRIEAEFDEGWRGTKSPLVRWRLRRALEDARAGRAIEAAAGVIRELRLGARAAGAGAGGVEVFEAPGELLFCNGIVGLAFARANGGVHLAGLHDCAADREFLAAPTDPSALWRVTVSSDAGEAVAVTDADARGPIEMRATGAEGARSRTVALRWGGVTREGVTGSFAVAAEVSMDAGEPLTRWRVAVEDPAGRIGLREVEFPVVNGIDGRTASGERETVAYPSGWGVLETEPRCALRYRGVYPSGSCAMQFAAYGVGGRGLYYGAHDGRAHTKELRLRCDADGAITFSWAQPPPDMTRPGAGYVQPYDVMLGVHGGDWYDAARLYRAWALRQPWCALGPVHARADIPRRFKELAMWGRTRPDPRDAAADNARLRDRFPVPLANHWYNWHRIRFDDNYPEYFPARDGFRQTVAAAHRLGVWQMPYINGRLWDTDLESFARTGRAHCTKDERGAPCVETYGSGQKLAAMCPHTTLWQEKVGEIVRRLIGEEGVAGVYIDQVAAAAPRLCLDPAHGHPLGGGCWWVDGYRKMLDAIRGWIGARHPDCFLTTESNAEPYMALFDGYLMCNSTRDKLIPLFSAVYHDHNLTFGRYVFASDLRKGAAYHMKMGQLFAFGAQLAWIPADILEEKNRAGADFLLRLAELRARALPYLAFGDMLRPPRLTGGVPMAESAWDMHGNSVPVRFPALHASAWRAPDGSVGLTFVNVLGDELAFGYEFDPAQAGFARGAPIVLSEIVPGGEREIARLDGATAVARAERIPGHGARAFTIRNGK